MWSVLILKVSDDISEYKIPKDSNNGTKYNLIVIAVLYYITVSFMCFTYLNKWKKTNVLAVFKLKILLQQENIIVAGYCQFIQ